MKIPYEIHSVDFVSGGNWGGTTITVKYQDGRKINKSLQTVLTDIINIINDRKSMDTTWYENFIKVVKDMRSAQKEYFKTRNYIILENAKKLEREVDKLLEENNDL
jgi:hypothetical protein